MVKNDSGGAFTKACSMTWKDRAWLPEKPGIENPWEIIPGHQERLLGMVRPGGVSYAPVETLAALAEWQVQEVQHQAHFVNACWLYIGGLAGTAGLSRHPVSAGMV